jgi:hypothetical protein
MDISKDTLAICTAVRLGAAGIMSTMLLTAGGLLCGLTFIGSMQPWIDGVDPDADVRIVFWGFTSFVLAVVFILWGSIGIWRVLSGYKRLDARTADIADAG